MNSCARKEQSQLFDLFECIWLDRGQSQIGFFTPKRPVFIHAFLACSEVPCNILTMVQSLDIPIDNIMYFIYGLGIYNSKVYMDLVGTLNIYIGRLSFFAIV